MLSTILANTVHQLMSRLAMNKPVRDWRNQRVWIIGASSGIGAALGQRLLAVGANVILSARRTVLLEQVAAHHASALVLALDVQDESAWKAGYKTIQDKFSGVDFIIFCAADYCPERCWEVVPEMAWRTLKINLASVYSGLATVLPEMIRQGQGGIGLVASAAGYMGLPNASVYGPSKAALINLSEILYGDLHPKGINVYLINPGFVATGLTQKNSFYMPALITAQQAAESILRGFAIGQFEIHFPRRFTQVVKLVRLLPYRLRFYLFKRLFYDPLQ